jgi:hypothetical protein
MIGDPADQPALDIEDQHRLTRAAAAAFLARYVAGTEECDEFLTPDFFEEIGSDLQTFESD